MSGSCRCTWSGREGNRTGKLVLGRVVCGVVHELDADAGVEAVELGGEVVDIIRA